MGRGPDQRSKGMRSGMSHEPWHMPPLKRGGNQGRFWFYANREILILHREPECEAIAFRMMPWLLQPSANSPTVLWTPKSSDSCTLP